MRSSLTIHYFIFSSLALLALGACSAIQSLVSPLPQFPDPTLYVWEPLTLTLSEPVTMAHAGDGSGRIFVVEKEGQIRILLDGEVFPEPFLDIRQKVGIQRWEQGFLGLAFHPNYVENGLFFVNYTNVNFNTVIASYTVSEDDPNVANQNSEKIVLEVNQPDSEHNGGQIEFGRDGYFYIAFGDGGSPGYNSQTRVSGQSLDNYLGKILRLDMENGPPYSFPRDNPLDGEKEQIEILAYGLRNPWRFSVDWVSGDMFIADVGQSSWEEINLLRRDSQLPVNFGWNYYQSSDPYFEPGPPDLIWERPIVAYAHEDGRCAIIGGLIYRGEALPDWDGIYFYSDFCSGEIFGLIPTKDGGWESQLLYESSINVTSFGMDEAGELYILDREGGVYRLVESSETN